MSQASSVAQIAPHPAIHQEGLSSPSDFFLLSPDQMVELVRSNYCVQATFIERIRAFIMLGRPRTCIPGFLCYNLGHFYMRAPFSAFMLLGELLAFLIGFLANIHNAYSDVEEDSHNLPGRLYLILYLGYKNLFRASIGLMCFMLLGSAVIRLNFFLFMSLAVCGSYLYSSGPGRAKERPILGLWVFSQAVAFPFVFGWATEPDRLFAAGMSPLLWVLLKSPFASDDLIFQGFRYLGMLIFITLWFMAKGTFKNVPDFHGDLAAGVRTSATACGTWRKAAATATLATVGAYLSLGMLAGLRLEPPRILISLVWLFPVIWNCLSLMRAEDGAIGNMCLKRDMLLSSGFIATVLLLQDWHWQNWVVVGFATAVLLGSDFFGIDSRRKQDVPAAILRKRAISA